MATDPPFHQAYKSLIEDTSNNNFDKKLVLVEECELPLIDLSRLLHNDNVVDESECKEEIARASRQWGFFQVTNHGISKDLLEKMREEQVKVFKQPFDKKSKEDEFMNFPAGSYRWGTPTATCLNQLSWSEAFHIPMADISASAAAFTTLRYPFFSFFFLYIFHNNLPLTYPGLFYLFFLLLLLLFSSSFYEYVSAVSFSIYFLKTGER